jgi:hypothetical protein
MNYAWAFFPVFFVQNRIANSIRHLDFDLFFVHRAFSPASE